MNKLLEIERNINTLPSIENKTTFNERINKIKHDLSEIEKKLNQEQLEITQNVEELMNEILCLNIENMTIDDIVHYKNVIEHLENILTKEITVI